jgi:plasmid maintenance system antidote protein VapI
MTPEFWLNLQRMYDLDVARAAVDISTIDVLVDPDPQQPSQ